MVELPSVTLPKLPASLIVLATGAESVEDVTIVQSLWSGYGNLYRCALEGGDRRSAIVKHVCWPSHRSHPRGWNSDFSHRRKVRSYEVESYWYQHLASRCDAECRIAESLAVVSHGDEVVVVLEDLDEAGYSARRSQVSNDELHACLRWLAAFHATFLGSSPDGIWEVGSYWNLETRPEEFLALADGALKDAAPILDARLSNCRFQTFVHGDAKLANFCFSPDGTRVAAVDFQYVGGGCGMKDVAYFLSSCLNESECEFREAELLDTYFSLLRTALARRKWEGDVAALETEWRAMYPIAWTDFYRFLQGWSPGHWKIHRYSEEIASEVLAAL